MCGIHGVINGNTKAEINTDDFIKSSFVANMLRGMDSSGIAVINDNTVEVAKLPVAGVYLPGHKHAAHAISMARQKATASICHVRAATVGGINYSNTHPFNLENENEEIVGVHNGTLSAWAYKKGASNYSVDSAWAISRILDDKADAFEDFTGSYAFVWWQSSMPDVLCMARNKERPLFVANTVDGNLVYASEAGMIHWLCERHRIRLKGNLKELEPGYLYQFEINDPTKFKKTLLPTPKVAVYSSTANDNFNRAYGTSYGRAQETTVTKLEAIFKAIEEKSKKTVQLELVSSQDNGKSDFVTRDELSNAMTLGMLGVKGTFSPIGSDDGPGHLYGAFVSHDYDGECHAVMRDVPHSYDWSSTESVEVRVEGIVDEGNEFIFVVSRPIVAAVAA